MVVLKNLLTGRSSQILIYDAVSDTSLPGMQIDDEAFDRFEVSGSAIILSTTSEYQPHQDNSSYL